MKVKELVRFLNDHGTNPHIKVYDHSHGCRMLVYEGRPDGIDDDAGKLKLNSFTVLGKGFIEIFAEQQGGNGTWHTDTIPLSVR